MKHSQPQKKYGKKNLPRPEVLLLSDSVLILTSGAGFPLISYENPECLCTRGTTVSVCVCVCVSCFAVVVFYFGIILCPPQRNVTTPPAHEESELLSEQKNSNLTNINWCFSFIHSLERLTGNIN